MALSSPVAQEVESPITPSGRSKPTWLIKPSSPEKIMQLRYSNRTLVSPSVEGVLSIDHTVAPGFMAYDEFVVYLVKGLA